MSFPFGLNRTHRSLKQFAALVLVALALPACRLSTAPPETTPSSPPAMLLSAAEAEAAETNYLRYCALCHGEDREGHANDHAPSLRSASLIESGAPWYIGMTTSYGRAGTPMGGYLDEIGGPMSQLEIRQMMLWLINEADAKPVRALTQDERRVEGDVDRGSLIYTSHCASCHGADGGGGTGTALGNQAMLSQTPDAFLRYAIQEGRQGTAMPAFADTLSAEDIDAVTAFLRSRSGGWSQTNARLYPPPDPANYVINPTGPSPDFTLRDGMYVLSADLSRALSANSRMVILDTRVTSMWQKGHIAGAVPVPYYSSREEVVSNLPRDGTWIVAYCECPRAAAESIVRQLRTEGLNNSVVLWEGVGGWIAMGYPLALGGEAVP